MKKALAVIVILLFVYRYSYAQEQGLYEIKIEQDFNAYNNCMAQGYPYLSDMTITANDIKDSVGEIITYSDKRHTSFFVCTLDSLNETISIKNKITGLGNKGEDYFQETKIRLSDLKTGRNTGVWTVSDSHHCSIFHTEGYTMNTSITIDDPINLKGGENAVIDIDKGGEWSVEVEKFYDDGKCEVYLEYNVNSADSPVWNRIANNEIVVKPGTINLRYEDIVGKKSDTNDKYKESIGKFITLRAVKVFSSSGVKTYGATIQSRFYQSGPDFEIMTIRRPACEDSLNIYVKVDKDALVNPDEYEWKTTHNIRGNNSSGHAFKLNATKIDDEGFLKLGEATQSGNENITLASYLSDSNNKIEDGTWILQLECIGKSEFNCVVDSFWIPAKLDGISVKQSDANLFERNGVKYHLTNTQDPYVVLKIEDNDPDLSRYPYKVYDKDSLLATINENVLVFPELTETEKSEILGSLNLEEYKKTLASLWYNEHVNDGLIRLEKISNCEQCGACYEVEPELSYPNYLVHSQNDTYHIYDIYGASNYNKIDSYEGAWDCSDLYSSEGHELEVDKGSKYWIELSDEGYGISVAGNSVNDNCDICGEKKYPEVNKKILFGNWRCIVYEENDHLYFRDFQLGKIGDISLEKMYENYYMNSNNSFVGWYEDNKKVDLFEYKEESWEFTKTIDIVVDLIDLKALIDSNGIIINTTKGYYKQRYSNPTLDQFLDLFETEKTWIDETYITEKIEAYKQRKINEYYLKNKGYHVHGITINANDTLTLVDNDSCSYEIPYRVNVLDDLKIDEVSRSNPKSGNSADGTATLVVKPGGAVDYYYDNKIISGETKIDLDSLHWGDNQVEFTDTINGNVIRTHTVTLLPTVEFTTTPQTCATTYGAITPTGKDAEICSQWQHKNPSLPNSDEYWENGLDNLKAGTYAVRGKFGDLWVDFGNQTVANEIFSIEVNKVKDAAEIGGTGSVELISNYSDISADCTYNNTWADSEGLSVFEYNDLSAQKYNWTVTHDGCSIPIEFEIKAPKVELVNASVTYNTDTKEAHVHVEGKKNDLVSSYQFTVDGTAFTNDITLSGKNAGNTIPLGLKYTSTIDNKEHTTDIKEITLLSYTPQVTVDTAHNNKRCPSHLGRVTLSGASGGELAVDNSNQYEKIEKDGFQYIPNNPNDTIHTLHFRKTETINYDFGEIENTIVHDVSNVVIAEPKQPYIRIAKSDVTCKGSGNGELYIDDAQNVRGAAQYSLDKSMWYSSAITSLAPETYHIYTRDSVCPSDIDSCDIKIEEPSNKLQVSIADNDITNPTCRDNDGKIVISAIGGWGDYLAYTSKLTADKYESLLDTSNIENNFLVDSLKSGDHAIYVHDGGGCVVEVNAKLEPYTSPEITVTTTNPARCYGSADGEIVINAVTVDCSVEDKPLSLLIDSRSDTLSLTNPFQTIIKGLSKGNYNLMLIDVNDCPSVLYNVSISQPEPLKVEARLLDGGRILYNGGNEGRMEVKVSGGNVGIDSVFYNNSNVLVSTGVPYIVDGMSAGHISITASDRYNCPCNDTTLTFIEPEEPITIETESQAALCHAQTGSVKVTATGGWGAHRISLVGNSERRNSGEQSETTFESLYAGDYEIEVVDNYGATATQRVRVDAPEPISHELITTPDHCDGNGGGMIELSGGTGDYVSLFNMGADSIHGNRILVGNLVGGREYTLTTWDANRCESRMTFTMPDEQLRAEIKYAYNANGSATLTAEVKGGIAPYTYKWRNVSGGEELGTSSTQTVTKSGLYRLEIADASGCSYNTMQDVLMAGSIVMHVKSVTRATNPENNNGAATIICKATQPTDLRLYHLETDTWTSSITMQDETTINIEGLPSGHYCVEGELDNGNMQTAMFEIAPYVEMKVIKTAVKHVSAPGRNDASVVIDFDGGIAPYVLNNATYPNSHIELNNLEAGKITLSIVDSTGNVLTKDVEILEPEPLVVTPSRVDSASCYSYSDGSVQLTATGGWPGYQFANGNGDYRNSAYFGELNAGERTFKVVDKYGVEDSVKVTVGEPDMLRASVAAIDSVSCKGLNDGAAHFAVTGGTAPYRTIYEKETLDGTYVAHLLSGSYVMKFTDSHNCKSPDTISIYIPEPDLLELANDYVTHTTCELDNGKIAIEVKGGSLPYRYEWKENGATYGGAKTVNMVRSEAENLKQNGLYHIDITDLHGCHTQYEMRIEHSENPRVMGVATTDVLCYGSSDGIAEVDSSQVKWGYPKVNYHLTWPQGQTGVMSVNTLPAGTHIVRITDDNNCTTTREFTVGTPEPVKNHLASVRDALCYGYSDGRIETHTTGGVGDYTYVWNTGETTSYADSLKAGLYTIVVTDSHECIDSATYEVGEPEELKVNLGNDVLICPGNVHVFDAGEYATYSWRHAASGEEIATERYLAIGDEGDYAIKVTDEIGCIARDTVNITIGENALEANFLMASDAAVNDTIMLVELSNLPVDSVRWEYEPLTFVDIDDAESYMLNLSAENTGRYYITMWAYSGGCESFEQKFIDIYEAVADTSDFKIGYDPLIKQAKVSPNPNDGEFDLIVVLRETYDIDVTVYDVNNGRQVEHVVLKDSDRYNTRLNIRQWGSGIFVLSVSSGTERRAIKVLCVR